MLRELFAPNIQRIKSIRAIGTMLQKVLLRFRIFLCGLILAKAISLWGTERSVYESVG